MKASQICPFYSTYKDRVNGKTDDQKKYMVKNFSFISVEDFGNQSFLFSSFTYIYIH